METIFRVENAEGQGPYIGTDIEIRFNHQDKSHPAPQEDKGINRQTMYFEICGFKDLNQAHNWFSQYELAWLAKEGYILKEMEVNKITAIGEKQVLAIRN